MINHIVLLQPKEGTTQEEIHIALQRIEDLQQHISGIVRVQTGKNLSTNHQGYIYGFEIQFIDRAHLEAYAPHPKHQMVSDELVRICKSIIDFDIEEL